MEHGILRKYSVKVTASSSWPQYQSYNKVENLLDFDSCDDCRWFSQSVPNSYVIFRFNEKQFIAAYSLQAYQGVYPMSWDVYYTLNDDENWQLLDHQEPYTFLSTDRATKKFSIKPRLVKKIKFVQLSSYSSESAYVNCFVLRRVEFFPFKTLCTANRNRSKFQISILISALLLL